MYSLQVDSDIAGGMNHSFPIANTRQPPPARRLTRIGLALTCEGRAAAASDHPGHQPLLRTPRLIGSWKLPQNDGLLLDRLFRILVHDADTGTLGHLNKLHPAMTDPLSAWHEPLQLKELGTRFTDKD